jgi:succinate dehydrogenase/fumarate reductase flavoprotein subunit
LTKLRDASSGYDVIVIGAGAAGMSAALFSAIKASSRSMRASPGFE